MSQKPSPGRIVLFAFGMFAFALLALALVAAWAVSSVGETSQVAEEKSAVGASVSTTPGASATSTPVVATTPDTREPAAPQGTSPAQDMMKPAPSEDKKKEDLPADVGDCVLLGGTPADPTIERRACDAADYSVADKVSDGSECVGDSDQRYTLPGAGGEGGEGEPDRGVLCLDVNWVVGACMDTSGVDPRRIDCAEPAPETVRVLGIQQDADDVSACGRGGVGYVYAERRFVVCVEEL